MFTNSQTGRQIAALPLAQRTLGDANTPIVSLTGSQLGWSLGAVIAGMFVIGAISRPTIVKATRRVRRKAQQPVSPWITHVMTAVAASVASAIVVDEYRRRSG